MLPVPNGIVGVYTDPILAEQRIGHGAAAVPRVAGKHVLIAQGDDFRAEVINCFIGQIRKEYLQRVIAHFLIQRIPRFRIAMLVIIDGDFLDIVPICRYIYRNRRQRVYILVLRKEIVLGFVIGMDGGIPGAALPLGYRG